MKPKTKPDVIPGLRLALKMVLGWQGYYLPISPAMAKNRIAAALRRELAKRKG